MFRVFKIYGLISAIPLFFWAFICVVVNGSLDITRQDWALDSIRLRFVPLGFLDYLLPALLLTLAALLINLVFQENDFTKTRDSYAGAYFILLSCFVPKAALLSWHYAYVLGLIIALYFLFRMYRRVEKSHLVFNLAFCCGLLLVLESELWPLALLFFLSIWQVSYLKISEVLLFIFSFCLPFYFIWIYKSFDHIPVSLSELWDPVNYSIELSRMFYFLPVWILIGLILILYFFRLDGAQKAMRIGAKKFSTVLWICLFTLLGICLLSHTLMPKTLQITSVILSILLALLATQKKPLHQRFFMVFLGLLPIMYLCF